MAKLKAIRISKDNLSKLANDYAIDEPEDELPIGYWLVTAFGVDTHYETVSKIDFLQRYRIVRPILNDYIEIEKLA